tara:strand:- start:189 stop:656 length:468 start_codon:yes stop_codon:yes gene_type:complete
MIKLLIFFIILISHNIYAQYDSKDENRVIDTSDQIIILYNLAKKNIEDKEFKKSLKLLKALSRRDDLGNYEIEIFNLLGDSYIKIKKPNFEKSEKAYKKALDIDENNIVTHVNLIKLYLLINEKAKAEEMLIKLGKLIGTDQSTYKELKNEILNF